MSNLLAGSTRARPAHARLPGAVALVVACAAMALSPASALAKTSKTLYVSASATADPACSAASQSHPFATIPGALACAVAADTIKVGAGTFSGGFTIPVSVVLDGAGANKTTISNTTATGSPEVTVAPGLSATIENLAVSGKGGENGGILAGSGSLLLSKVSVDSTFDLTSGDPAAVAVLPASGAGSLTMLDSTVSNAVGLDAGGVAVEGVSGLSPSNAVIANSTISGNYAENYAGGVYVAAAALTLRSDTIAANSGGAQAGGIDVTSDGTATISDSLIATNTGRESSSPDCTIQGTGQVTDGGHNLIGVASPGTGGDCGFVTGMNGDLAGTTASPLNPHLGPLAANGGTTKTQAVKLGSPAIAAGAPADCEGAPVGDFDQRGVSRAATTRLVCDIGAYDTAGKGGKTLTVLSTVTTNPACAKSKPFATISAALACAVSGDTVKVGAGRFSGGFTIPANVVLEGLGANQTTISNSSHISPPEVTVAPLVTATVQNLAVSGTGGTNAGILATSGGLVLRSVSVDSAVNLVPGDPAAVSLVPLSGTGSLTVFDSTVSNGVGTDAGGVAVEGPSSAARSSATVINSTISGNRSQGYAGGVYLAYADLTARDDTIAGNNGAEGAGGLDVSSGATATVVDSLLATNTPAGSFADCETQSTGDVIDGGSNLVGVASPGAGACGFVNGSNGDLVGSPGTPLNPELAPLAANGGTTQTQALQATSPAISAGRPADCEAAPVDDLDQRGDSRAATTRHACDIGAYDTGGGQP